MNATGQVRPRGDETDVINGLVGEPLSFSVPLFDPLLLPPFTSSIPCHYLVTESIFQSEQMMFAGIILCIEKMEDWRIHAQLANADRAEGLIWI